jgi:hypothetical protein
MISKMQLEATQKMCFIVDLHFSHKGDIVEILQNYNIIPVYIPAGCTDLHQVCDIVVNRPLKNGTRTAFIQYVASKYAEYAEAATESETPFRLDLSMGVMKPLIPFFVEKGIQCLKTEDMKAAIVKCFLKDSLVEAARLPETYKLAVQRFPASSEEVAIISETEPEEDLGLVEDELDVQNNDAIHFVIELSQA